MFPIHESGWVVARVMGALEAEIETQCISWPGDLAKMQMLTQYVCGGVWVSTFLTIFQVILMLSVHVSCLSSKVVDDFSPNLLIQ